MTHQHEAQHRSHFEASGGDISVREPDGGDDGDGLFRIRMPVSSTTEARDGDAFGRDRVEGFARQIEAGDIGVFLDHGRSGPGDSRYSALSKVGYWAEPEVADRDAGAELVADAVLLDPAELDGDVGQLRTALWTLKRQAEAGLPLASSVGWSEDTGDRDVPGGADLLEISIVGIPSDPRTTTTASRGLRAPVPEQYSHGDMLAAKEQAEEMGVDGGAIHAHGEDDDRSFMPGANHASIVAHLRQEGLMPEEESRAEYEVGDTTVDISPPEAMVNAATLALAKKDEFGDAVGDCGTGVGEQRARQIIDDDVGPDVVDEIAAYLTSHEEDVSGISDTPSQWSEETWTDGCGPVQYALWGGTATGTGLDWAQRKANEVARARDEDEPYPNRDSRQMTRNLDDPEFSSGDAVSWSSQGATVHGRVNDIHEQYSPAEGVTITGDDGEAVYSIFEWDDDMSPPRFQDSPSDPNVAKPESSLSESQMDMPPATAENFEGDEENMADESPSDEQSDDTTDAQTRENMEEMMAEMVDMQEQQLKMLEEMYEEGHGDEGDGEEDDGEMSANSDGGDAERTVTLDGEERAVDEALADLREQAADVDADTAESQTENRASEEGDTETSGFGLAARMED